MSGALLPATQSMIVVLGFYRDDTRASAARCDTAYTIILHLNRLHKSMSSICLPQARPHVRRSFT